ncbi:ester cyclase [Streptomyces yangpuensis]|uniref:ester cyclase n=1 Tax=Streptomyces yangpuensis TaxID=1648182 RepID=UPI00363C23F7
MKWATSTKYAKSPLTVSPRSRPMVAATWTRCSRPSGLWRPGDLDTAQNMLAEDFIANLPGGAAPRRGRAIWREGAQAMLEAFPDLEIDVQDIFGADGPRPEPAPSPP